MEEEEEGKGWIDGWMDGEAFEWEDRQTDSYWVGKHTYRYIHTDRQTDRQHKSLSHHTSQLAVPKS